MLWTPKPVHIAPDDIFDGDRLGREPFVENVADLLENSPEPLVISVDGPWGSGKTTFLSFLAAVLQDRGLQTLSFSAWEHDFVPDPMVALVGEFAAHVEGLRPAKDKRLARAKQLEVLGCDIAVEECALDM